MGISGVTAEVYEYLKRMAKVLASPLNVRIMIALGVRPMSPTMLESELADDRYSARIIDKHLQELERSGWVELADTMSGGPRRGATEHVYRAVRLPIFDEVTWPALPLAMREMVTWRISEALVKYLSDAWGAGALAVNDDHHCTCTPGFVDQLGWDRIIASINCLFEDFIVEMQGATLRLAKSGESPIQALVVLACFESPSDQLTPQLDYQNPLVRQHATSSKYDFSLRMAKAMSHPLWLMILNELSVRAMSAKMFLEEFRGRKVEGLSGAIHKSEVYRAFRMLRQFGWLVLVDTKPHGTGSGGQEHLYRAIRPSLLGNGRLPALPRPMKDDTTGRTLSSWIDRLGEAMRTGTMDARDDRHFTWTLTGLDRLGWGRIVRRMDALRGSLMDELSDARTRLEESGEQPISITVALASVESAVASMRVEPGLPFA